MRIIKKISVGVIFAIIGLPSIALSIDAARYVVIPANAQIIDTEKEPYSVSFLYGWVSSEDGIIKRIFSDKKNGTLQLSVRNTFFDGESTTNEHLTLLQNLANNTNRPVGQTIQIHDKVPGDINTRISFKLALYREDTISTVIKAVESSKEELPTDFFAGPWIGYSKLVSGITKNLFGSTETDYPFYWTGDIKVNDIVSADGKMKEHYVVLVSPQKDRDTEFNNLKKSKLDYNELEQKVLYDGNPLTKWSYAVLRVAKTSPYKIEELVYDSTAPWALLAQRQFLTLPLSNVDDLKVLNTISQNSMTQLNNEIDLLKKERRFSKYDRAVALYGYTQSIIGKIKLHCENKLKVAEDQCPVGELAQFSNSIVGSFGLKNTPELAGAVAKDAQKIIGTINIQMEDAY